MDLNILSFETKNINRDLGKVRFTVFAYLKLFNVLQGTPLSMLDKFNNDNWP